jgi:hypothetical protein
MPAFVSAVPELRPMLRTVTSLISTLAPCTWTPRWTCSITAYSIRVFVLVVSM